MTFPKREGPAERSPQDVGQDAGPIVTWAQLHRELFGCSIEDCRGSAHVRDAMSRYRAAVMAEALAAKRGAA
jgi:hypothetical protein